MVLDGRTSGMSTIISGVPQGSILGPLLYILYTADILGCIKNCSCQMYADDTQLIFDFFPYEHHMAEYKVNQDLKALSDLSATP